MRFISSPTDSTVFSLSTSAFIGTALVKVLKDLMLEILILSLAMVMYLLDASTLTAKADGPLALLVGSKVTAAFFLIISGFCTLIT